MNKKILASVLVIGVVATVAGGSTFALFNDTETSSGNTFTAGELDLTVDWNETYNGEFEEYQPAANIDGSSIFELDDVKPGDVGHAQVSLNNEGNPAHVWMNATNTADLENGCTEPEKQVDNSCGEGAEGELQDHLEFTVYKDSNQNGEQESGEEVLYNGTAANLEIDNVYLGEFDSNETQYIGIAWNLPLDTGNVIQSDSKVMDFSFYAEQARHNDPENMTDPEDETPVDNETDSNITEPPVDDNMTDNETGNRAAISFVSYCVENGAEENGNQTASQPCPETTEQLVKFEWDGNSFEPEGGDAMNISINSIEFKENNLSEPVEADWISQQEISTAVVKSSQDICNYSGGTNGTVESCGPPQGQQN